MEDKDYSFSGVVSRIQGDKDLGRLEIIQNINYILMLDQHIKEAEKALQAARTQRQIICESNRYILKHLGIGYPICVVNESEAYTLYDTGEFKVTDVLEKVPQKKARHPLDN